MKDPDNPTEKYQNVYEYGQELSNAVWRISSYIGQPPENIGLKNPDFLLTRDGILDDLLIHTEDVYRIAEYDITLKVERIETVILIIVIGVSGLGILIFIMTIINELNLIKKKKYFADIFFTIRDEDFEEHLSHVQTYLGML